MRKQEEKIVTEILADRHPDENNFDRLASSLIAEYAASKNKFVNITDVLAHEKFRNNRQAFRLQKMKEFFEKRSRRESKGSLIKRQNSYFGFTELSSDEIKINFKFSIPGTNHFYYITEHRILVNNPDQITLESQGLLKPKAFVVRLDHDCMIISYYENNEFINIVSILLKNKLELRWLEKIRQGILRKRDQLYDSHKKSIIEMYYSALRISHYQLLIRIASQPNNHDVLNYLIKIAKRNHLEIKDIIYKALQSALGNLAVSNIQIILENYPDIAVDYKIEVPESEIRLLFKPQHLLTSSVFVDILLLFYQNQNKFLTQKYAYCKQLDPRRTRELMRLSIYQFSTEGDSACFNLFFNSYLGAVTTELFFPKTITDIIIGYAVPSLFEMIYRKIEVLYQCGATKRKEILNYGYFDIIAESSPENATYWSLFNVCQILSELSYPLKTFSFSRTAEHKKFKLWMKTVAKDPSQFNILDVQTVLQQAINKTEFPELSKNFHLLEDAGGFLPITIVPSWQTFTQDTSLPLFSMQNAVNMYQLSQRKREMAQTLHLFFVNEMGKWTLFLLTFGYIENKSEKTIQLFCLNPNRVKHDAAEDTLITMQNLLDYPEKNLQIALSEIMPTAENLNQFILTLKPEAFISASNEQKALEYCQLFILFFSNFYHLPLAKGHITALNLVCKLAKLCFEKQLLQFKALYQELFSLRSLISKREEKVSICIPESLFGSNAATQSSTYPVITMANDLPKMEWQ